MTNSNVHNHGPWDGPGMDCTESLIDGRLVGDCLAAGSWIGPLVHAEVLRMNQEARAQFNETVRRIDALADECEIRRVIADCWGHRTVMVEVPRG